MTDGVLPPQFPVLKMKVAEMHRGASSKDCGCEGEVTYLPGGHLSLLGARVPGQGARAEVFQQIIDKSSWHLEDAGLELCTQLRPEWTKAPTTKANFSLSP